ncbi:hypothetical protein SKAU_G00343940 [Synaphobranchus kaupii]|uniref:Uncharacterized protein n=1 Tax=Synaphobranchus kaupii TaxID=118154 RepID=A0A9Q1EJ31_SYNKA|nr:hypothetical protein SKAU_G00343940 [Synaphobranchus kaupii]
MGLGSLVKSQERQRFQEFLPEIAPERAASSLPLPPAAVTFRLEVTTGRLNGQLTVEIVAPRLWKNRVRDPSLWLLPEADPVP